MLFEANWDRYRCRMRWIVKPVARKRDFQSSCTSSATAVHTALPLNHFPGLDRHTMAPKGNAK